MGFCLPLMSHIKFWGEMDKFLVLKSAADRDDGIRLLMYDTDFRFRRRPIALKTVILDIFFSSGWPSGLFLYPLSLNKGDESQACLA